MGRATQLKKTSRVEKHIRCKCGKFWGMKYNKKTCKKCKSEVVARGEKN